MFAQKFGRNSQRMGQTALRIARAGTPRSYAAQAAAAEASTTTAKASAPGAFRRGASMAFVGLAFSTIGAVGTWYTMHSQGMGFHSDEISLTRFIPEDEEARLVEETINSHPFVQELRKNPNFTESRPHMKMPGSYRRQSLTGGALIGPGKMVVPPFAWLEPDGKSLVCIAYVGEELCGHPGLVHGGYLATMLDEGLGRCSFGALPHNIAVTANLNVDYRKPTPAGSYLVLKAHTVKVEGRKAWVKGHIELLTEPGEEPTILAEATGLFISPKYAAVMPRIQ